MANVNIPARVGFVANNNEDVIPGAARPPDDDISHGASDLRKFIDDLKESKEGAQEVGMFRHWIESMVDDGIEEGLGMKDHHNRTLLNVAAIEGLPETAKRLIDAGAFLDSQDEWGDTPLIDACGEGDGEGNYLKVVKLLLDKGAKADIYGNENESPLYRAAINGHSLIVQYLLGWDKVEWDLGVGEETYNMTPLHAAASAEDGKMVRYLRDKGAKLNLLDTDGWTPLMTAIASQRQDAVKELIRIRRKDEDLQLETEDSEGRSPILRAAQDSFWDGVKILVEAGAKCDKSETSTTPETDPESAVVPERDTALHFAVRENNLPIVGFLLEHGADVNARDEDGHQPLHLACIASSHDGHNKSISESEITSGTDHQTSEPNSSSNVRGDIDIVRLLLQQHADTNAETKNGETAMELAFNNGYNEIGETILDTFVEAQGSVSDAFIWAAGHTERHKIAVLLAKKRDRASEKPLGVDSKDWTAIEWMAHAREPRAFWLVIASSPQSKSTKKALCAATAIVRNYMSPTQRPATKSKDQLRGQADDKKVKNDEISLRLQDIIDNPPTGLARTDSATYSLPTHESRYLSSLETYHAAVVRFYKRTGQFGSIIRTQTVENTIYGQGPEGIMREAVKKFQEHSSGLDRTITESTQRPIFMDSEPKFTWIHLPATNMVWMNHLVQRIMKDENHPASHFNHAKSFFKDSWTEVPDKVSASRMMRPRFVLYADKTSEDGPGELGRGEGVAHERSMKGPAVSATAIYMPYLSYSFQCAETLVKPSQSRKQTVQRPLATEDPTIHNLSPTVQEAQDLWHSDTFEDEMDSKQEEKFEYAKRLFKARIKYQKLFDEYRGNIVHGSSTLDESYYHFGDDDDSTREKERRNTSQVTTDIWGDEEDLASYWLLIRVNQLWMWTIGNKWLISASSHPIDDGEDELVNGILERLENQGEDGVSNLQPGSTGEMSQLIVDYCIGSYDRKPKPRDSEKPWICKLKYVPSIRQVFSKSINSIARAEVDLFEYLSHLTKELRPRWSSRNTEEHGQAEKFDYEKLAKANIKSDLLSTRAKDVLDELGILDATAQYQQDVQRAMMRSHVEAKSASEDLLWTDLSATHVINDIKRLNNIAERALASTNTKVSVYQSEIANLQAELSIKHAELATRQGEILMVFTVTTIVFVPLSFMTSLFAVDVSSFQQAPAWAMAVIFSVAAAFVVPAFGYAFAGKLNPISYLRKLAKKSDRARDDDGVIQPETLFPRSAGPSSLQVIDRNPTSTAGSLKARKPAKSTVDSNGFDVEKGLVNGGD